MNKMKPSDNEGILSKMLSLYLKNFSKKMNGPLAKKLADFIFAMGEKIIIKMDKLLPLYVGYYKDIVNEEIKMADIHDGDIVLHIGCGPVPSTSILIAKKTNVSIMGIDKDMHAIKGANSSVQIMNLKNKIQIQHANALNFSIQDFDVIVFSQGVEPRYRILESISRSMKSNARLIFRTVSSVEGELASQDMILKNFFKILKLVSHENHGLLISLLLVKK